MACAAPESDHAEAHAPDVLSGDDSRRKVGATYQLNARIACGSTTKNGNPPLAFGSRPLYQGVKKNQLPSAAAALRHVLRVVHQERFAHAVIVEREVHDEPLGSDVALHAHRVGPDLALQVLEDRRLVRRAEEVTYFAGADAFHDLGDVRLGQALLDCNKVAVGSDARRVARVSIGKLRVPVDRLALRPDALVRGLAHDRFDIALRGLAGDERVAVKAG